MLVLHVPMIADSITASDVRILLNAANAVGIPAYFRNGKQHYAPNGVGKK